MESICKESRRGGILETASYGKRRAKRLMKSDGKEKKGIKKGKSLRNTPKNELFSDVQMFRAFKVMSADLQCFAS